MASKLLLSYVDYGTPQESSSVRLEGGAVTAATFDAQEAFMDALVAAIDNLSIGVRYKTEKTFSVVETAKAQPASAFAQRESKWLVRYHSSGSAGTRFTAEIPCADLDLLDPARPGGILKTDAKYTAFKAAFEAFVKDGANSVVVDDVVFVGRNL